MTSFNYKYDDLFNPVLKAFKNLGGSGSNDEIEDEVIKVLNLNDEQVSDIHRGSTTKLTYRLQWSRNYLKRFGLLENSQRGIWSLSEKGKKVSKVDPKEVNRFVKNLDNSIQQNEKTSCEIENETEISWQENLISLLLLITPQQFERLCQRMLRELGFINVEVTGRSNDGGVDGKGIIRIGGVLSFHILFQCKRWKNSIPPTIVRDFRGAMDGRADKGLIITTGTFSREARKEAQRVGALPIDLIDGFEFAEKLKELKLGVSTIIEESIVIDKEWFNKF